MNAIFWLLIKLIDRLNWLTIHWPWRRLHQLKIGKRVILGRGGSFLIDNDESRIMIGDGVFLGRNFRIISCQPIEIGDDSIFAWNVSIMTLVHSFGRGIKPFYELNHWAEKPVKIGKRCWVGCNVTILPGTVIGDECVIMANSVVKGVFKSGSIIGQPTAMLIKRYQTDEDDEAVKNNI